MSIENTKMAIKILEESENAYFSGPKSRDLVESAEAALGLNFPDSYKEFVAALGAVSFGATEIYGVTSSEFEHGTVPNGVWYTLSNRAYGLPDDLLLIGHSETGSPCIKVSESVAHVVIYHLGFPPENQTYEIIARDFGDYLYGKVSDWRDKQPQ